MAERPHWNMLLHTEEPIIQQGHITLSERPGIGFELNDEAPRKYGRPDAPFFE